MCRETIDPRVIQGQRVKCTGKTYYLPRNAPAKLRQQIQDAIDAGEMIDVELLQHYLIVRAYPDGMPMPRRSSVAIKQSKREQERSLFWSLGAYTWLCTRCGARVYASIAPTFCTKCFSRGG